ncbi:unnamed protein product [Pleuronectes platessa]|uniref:Uncharacterized protein n=1 Tax=Pleuronectes platessa TaxID=8262 RepID=A0A9N7YHX1_PLEPL|nr:unnamed protein product [Pleuronectes platessa]
MLSILGTPPCSKSGQKTSPALEDILMDTGSRYTAAHYALEIASFSIVQCRTVTDESRSYYECNCSSQWICCPSSHCDRPSAPGTCEEINSQSIFYLDRADLSQQVSAP